MNTPVTPDTREIYKMAYRNVRCARSTALNSAPTKIPHHWKDRDRVVEVVSRAIEHRESRNDFSNGWVNQQRRYTFIMQTIFKAS